MMNKQKGISLIELIIFIVVLGILGTGILIAFVVSLEKTPNINRISRATELAQERMEIIFGQKKLNGFTSMTDICDPDPSSVAICSTLPSEYEIETPTIQAWNSTTFFKEITINVNWTADTDRLSSLQAIVADY